MITIDTLITKLIEARNIIGNKPVTLWINHDHFTYQIEPKQMDGSINGKLAMDGNEVSFEIEKIKN